MKIAVVLVRGLVNVTHAIKDTLAMLKLTRKNTCIVVDNNPTMLGMIKKAKDYVTWGEISEETYKELVAKRGVLYLGPIQDSKKKYNYKTLEIEGKHYKPYFRLNPPSKGFGRKGIKMPFNKGGGLGPRSDKMNDLILRML
jgi:large subunit ribosomal protein L30